MNFQILIVIKLCLQKRFVSFLLFFDNFAERNLLYSSFKKWKKGKWKYRENVENFYER